ncbi:hypothetical protein ACROYT_G014705 [Oculina patagonica]
MVEGAVIQQKDTFSNNGWSKLEVDLKATEQDLTGDVLFTALVEPPRNYNFREEIVAACGKQRDFCELVEGDRNRERQYCNLLILCLYSFIPPSCGLEIRTLKICHDWQSFNQKDYKARNVLLIKGSEQVTLHFDSYKTVKWMGHQELTLKVYNAYHIVYTNKTGSNFTLESLCIKSWCKCFAAGRTRTVQNYLGFRQQPPWLAGHKKKWKHTQQEKDSDAIPTFAEFMAEVTFHAERINIP